MFPVDILSASHHLSHKQQQSPGSAAAAAAVAAQQRSGANLRVVIPSPGGGGGPNHLNAAAEDMAFNENMPYSLYVLQQNHTNGTNLSAGGRHTSSSSLNTPVVAMPALNYQGLNSFSAQDFSMNAINEAVATSSPNAGGISLTWQNSGSSTVGTISTSSTTGTGSSSSAVAPSQQNLIAGTLQHSR